MPTTSAFSFQQFTDNSDDVFWLADLDKGRLLYVNPRFEQVWGLSGEALMRDPGQWNGAVDPADAHLLPTPFFADSIDQECAMREYRILDAHGQLHWIRDRRFQVRDAQGKVTQVGGIAEDVTERKRIEAKREEFLAMVTHELRSPLNALRGWAHVLRRAGPLNPLQEKALAAIDRSTHAQARLVDDLLDSQRILLGEFQLQWGHVNLPDLIDEAVASVQDLAHIKRIHLDVIQDEAIGIISADMDRLRQSLINLLSNAVKFTPEDGTVHVRTRHEASSLIIEVQDSGIGLDSAQLPSVFNRFQQADRSSTRHQSGLGLGLSLARQVIALHGGHITVRSAGVGQGATFTIELPDELRPAEPVPPGQLLRNSLAGKRVWIVEDDLDGREVLELILREAHVELQSFDRAAGAYEHLTLASPEEQPDALISDIAMPDEDGYAFIHRVREMETRLHRPRLVALALTSFARKEDRQRALAAGFDDHVGKPIDSQVVLQTLENALSRP